MYCADRLIYLQLEKTACTHISKLLSYCVSGEQVEKHNPLRDYDASKLIVGSIRNPWNWYVSLWAYGAKGEGMIRKSTTRRSFQNALKLYSGTYDPFQFSSWLRKSPFKHSMQTLVNSPRGIWSELNKPVGDWKKSYEDPYDPACFRQWLELILGSARQYGVGVGYAQNSLSSFAGLMTYRYCRLYLRDFVTLSQKCPAYTLDQLISLDQDHNLLDGIIRTEFLESDLIKVLEQANYTIDDQKLSAIHSSPVTNASTRSSVDFYYDAETIELVSRKEKFIIDKYSYQPPSISLERTDEIKAV